MDPIENMKLRPQIPVSPISSENNRSTGVSELEDEFIKLPSFTGFQKHTTTTPLRNINASVTTDSQIQQRSQEQWNLVETLCQQLSTADHKVKSNETLETAPLMARLKQLLLMHKQLKKHEEAQQRIQIGLLMEIKLFSEILKGIEKLSKDKSSDPEDPLWQEVKDIMYRENSMFKLQKP
eukprot:TRINITY_DN3139_c0_g1_i1.p1 TRINITY_DN3139_c0_g1~~TRINITY_DN3139_c0_g1_i1.p1  ORF type:complete len:180 (+),score=23.39 TRINITY_DN3139_c0_g1_i1:58-597(+)